MIDLRLFRIPVFSASVATYGLTILILFGGFLFLPQYLQLVLGLSPLQAGLWTLPWSLAFVVGTLATPPLARRVPPATLMSAGLLLSAAGYWMVAGLGPSTGFARFAVATWTFAIGVAPVFTLTTDLIIGSAPPERAGAASAISETSAEFGGALGIAVFGSIGVAVYRMLLPDVMPLGLPADAGAAAAATLGGAVDAAGQLPTESGRALLDAARLAFVRGLRLCAFISAIGSLALAVFAAATLRRPRGEPGEAGESAGAEATAQPDGAVAV